MPPGALRAQAAPLNATMIFRTVASAGSDDFPPPPMPLSAPPAKPDALIEVDHVTFGYDATRTIIDDISLDFQIGRTHV